MLVIVPFLELNDTFFNDAKHDDDGERYNSRNRVVCRHRWYRLQKGVKDVEDVHYPGELEECGHWEESESVIASGLAPIGRV